MVLSKIKKIVSIPVTTIALLSTLLVGSATAGTWSPSVQWGPQEGSYSPDWGNTALYEYTNSSGQLMVSPQARFRFTQDAVNSIHNYYRNNSYYYTFDISNTDEYNTTVSAVNIFYSTLPNPHYDIDDDPELYGGNGYYDETEVVCLAPLSIVANTDYRFESHFRVYSKATTYFEYGSQMSYYLGFGEYDTKYFDVHLTRKYPW